MATVLHAHERFVANAVQAAQRLSGRERIVLEHIAFLGGVGRHNFDCMYTDFRRRNSDFHRYTATVEKWLVTVVAIVVGLRQAI